MAALVSQSRHTAGARKTAHGACVACSVFAQWYGHSVTRDSAKFCSGRRRQGAVASDVRQPVLDDPTAESAHGQRSGRWCGPCPATTRNKGRERESLVMPPATIRLLSVEEAATVLEMAPRTVRRWLQDGDLGGKKIGTTWVVLMPEERATRQTHRHGMRLTRQAPTALPMIRTASPTAWQPTDRRGEYDSGRPAEAGGCFCDLAASRELTHHLCDGADHSDTRMGAVCRGNGTPLLAHGTPAVASGATPAQAL